MHKLLLLVGLTGLVLESVFELAWRATLGDQKEEMLVAGLMVAYWVSGAVCSVCCG